jgi:hypothetical protein
MIAAKVFPEVVAIDSSQDCHLHISCQSYSYYASPPPLQELPRVPIVVEDAMSDF